MTALAVAVGLLPAVIALLRDHYQRGAITWLNVGAIALFVFHFEPFAIACLIVLSIYAAVTQPGFVEQPE